VTPGGVAFEYRIPLISASTQRQDRNKDHWVDGDQLERKRLSKDRFRERKITLRSKAASKGIKIQIIHHKILGRVTP
jgi:hypothetical protein